MKPHRKPPEDAAGSPGRHVVAPLPWPNYALPTRIEDSAMRPRIGHFDSGDRIRQVVPNAGTR
jgi:hypothetical protein